jgi:hypothetical protein
MKLAQIENGTVVNAIEVDPSAIPDWAADWPELVDGAGIGWQYDGQQYSAAPPPPPEEVLAEAKSVARGRLLVVMAGARTQMITDLPGQDMIYLAKEAEARAWVADGVPDPANYPLLSAEVGITAPDAPQLVQLWLNMATLWRAAAAQLEALRMSVSSAIDTAATPEDVAEALSMLAILTD